MQLPQLTSDQIQQRCTAKIFTRGVNYFQDSAISNPVLHGWTLSATCLGSSTRPYHVSVELMPTGVLSTRCTCPYNNTEGDCKHIIALLLTYTEAPQTICIVDTLLITLAVKPKANLLRVISELLKRNPELAPIVQTYADVQPTLSHSEQSRLTTVVYRERIDHIFGRGFLEQHQLRNVLVQLETLIYHAESLAQLDETEFALAILYALIHQSIIRYSDTLQQGELPQFVNKCSKTFTQIARTAQQPTQILEYCQMLLQLSFDAQRVFIPPLTCLIEQLCLDQDTEDLQLTLEQRLRESRDRPAHVRLLLALYLHTGQTETYLRLARREGERYCLIHRLFLIQHDEAAWEALQKFPLSVDEYWQLLKSPIANRIPDFPLKLFKSLTCHHPDTAISAYHKIIKHEALSRNRKSYEKVRKYLTDLKELYQHCKQEHQWNAYLTNFRKEHARKLLLLQIISEI